MRSAPFVADPLRLQRRIGRTQLYRMTGGGLLLPYVGQGLPAGSKDDSTAALALLLGASAAAFGTALALQRRRP